MRDSDREAPPPDGPASGPADPDERAPSRPANTDLPPGPVLDFYLFEKAKAFQNAGNYVFGVCDRNFTVRGVAPAMWISRNDLDPPCTGLKWSIISLGCLRLPFISYAGARFLAYAGWQPNGFFGVKFNLRNTNLQVV